MSDRTLEEYAQELIADVLATAEAESTTTPQAFTRRALDDLEQAGVTENTFAAYHKAYGIEVSGYGSNESLDALDVFITSFRQDPRGNQDQPDRGRDAVPPCSNVRAAVPRRTTAADR